MLISFNLAFQAKTPPVQSVTPSTSIPDVISTTFASVFPDSFDDDGGAAFPATTPSPLFRSTTAKIRMRKPTKVQMVQGWIHDHVKVSWFLRILNKQYAPILI